VQRFGNWRDNLPLGVFFAFVFLVWVGLQVAFRAGDHGGVRTADLIGYLVGGLIFAGLMSGLLAYRRRRTGGSASYAAINEAVRTGTLPEDAEPGIWSPELDRRGRALVRARVANPIIFGLFAALSVSLLFTDQAGIVFLLTAVFFVAFGTYNFFLCRRMLTRVQSLQRQLGRPYFV
jgi:hypothetical protein